IGDDLYDLTEWRDKHPAGRHWIDRYKDRDATDVFEAIHSDRAFRMLAFLPKVKDGKPVEPNQVAKDFRSMRAKLAMDGLFDRVWYKDAWMLTVQLGIYIAGIVLAKTNPILGTLVLGMAHTTCGWLSHDLVNGRGRFCTWFRHFGALVCGCSTTWWAQTHNIHHVFTNVVGVDEDIMVGILSPL
ncbi:unnamed protein product, partial [Discosporangium mesarthrocarpum]